MKILAIETSTPAASAAVCEDDRTLAEINLDAGVKHGDRLLVTVNFLLEKVGMTPGDIEAFAVDNGPGSFTGVRTGLALVKGFVMAKPVPVASVSSLRVLAEAGRYFEGVVMPVIDAKKGEVYTAAFESDGRGGMSRMTDDSAMDPGKVASMVEGPVLALGDGLLKYMDAIVDGREIIAAPRWMWPPRASLLAALALEKIQDGNTEDVDGLLPAYCRNTDAELKLGPRQ